VLGERAGAGMAGTTAYLFGRRTYEKMAAHWPHVGPDDPFGAHLNATPKYVVSRTLDDPVWSGTEVLPDVDAVREVKASGDGTLAVLGSGVLVQDLFATGLVDRVSLFLHPLVLGTGKRLFRELPSPVRLELESCTPTTTGVILADYRVLA